MLRLALLLCELTIAVVGLTPVRLPAPMTRPVTYSNPLGATLVQVRENVWLAERPFYPRLPGLQKTDVGSKASIVRLKDGSLFVHSPVELDDDLRSELAKIGNVKYIVSPNSEHVKYAQQWIDAYPDAMGYAAPQLKDRFPQISWQKEVLTDLPTDEFHMAWIDAERAPFKILGDKPFFSEVVFCHKPSKVLFVTDLWWNYPRPEESPANLGAPRLWKFGMDVIYRPVYNSLMRQRPRHDTILSDIFSWDFDFIAPCHGEPISGPDVKSHLMRFLDFSPSSS